jgi:hypothetical protein
MASSGLPSESFTKPLFKSSALTKVAKNVNAAINIILTQRKAISPDFVLSEQIQLAIVDVYP